MKQWPFITSILIVVGSALLALGCDFFLIALTWLLVAGLCLAGALIWCAAAIAAIVLFFKGLRKTDQRMHACIPAICLATALVIAPLVFYACNRADLFFRYNRARYEEVASMALKGKLEQKGRDFQLPPNYKGLSATNSVWLYRRSGATDVMFITAGFGGEVVGYVYSSDGQTPLPGTASRPISGAGKHWYHGSNDGCEIVEEGVFEKHDESTNRGAGVHED